MSPVRFILTATVFPEMSLGMPPMRLAMRASCQKRSVTL
jgi:hypothetical protein